MRRAAGQRLEEQIHPYAHAAPTQRGEVLDEGSGAAGLTVKEVVHPPEDTPGALGVEKGVGGIQRDESEGARGGFRRGLGGCGRSGAGLQGHRSTDPSADPSGRVTRGGGDAREGFPRFPVRREHTVGAQREGRFPFAHGEEV